MKSIPIMLSLLVLSFFTLAATTSAQTASDSKTRTPAQKQHSVAKGEISAIDLTGHTVTLTEAKKTVSFSFDEKTHITQAGHTVQASALTIGEKATVRYQERDGKNWATSIHISSAQHAMANTAKTSGNSLK